MTYNLLLILIMIIAVLLILIVLVQNPKGGGLSSSITGGTGSTIGGVQSTNNFLDKATCTLAITLLALILLSSLAIPRETSSQSELQETIEQVDDSATQEATEDIDALLEQTPAEEE